MDYLEQAQAQVSLILRGLRNETIKTVSDWQPLYNKALGLVDHASKLATVAPKGGG